MLNCNIIHPSWRPLVDTALTTMDATYLEQLVYNQPWLPGLQNIFNAFSLPLSQTRYLLIGESPYPRAESANGYAFWDAAVHPIWSSTGFTKPLNRATSLRNFLKMLLVAEHALTDDTSQTAIAALEKQHYVQTLDQLFQRMLTHGFLLLNASLVLSDMPVQYDAKRWRPFIASLLRQLHQHQPTVKLLLFGKIAHVIEQLDIPIFNTLIAEHPYNISFIHNPAVLDFFRPLHLINLSAV